MSMAKKGRVKRQHFVPQCLLRRFSKDDQTASVFVIGTRKFVPTAAIKTQCARDYYYGHDQTIEDDLGRLEGAFSSAIGDLSPERIALMSEVDFETVRAFVHIQSERTPVASENHRGMFTDLGRQLVSAYARVNSLQEINVDELAGQFASEQMPIPGAYSVTLAQKHLAQVADLEVKFVTARGLMISDHPVLSLNLWRDQHPRFSESPHLGGLLTKGFMYAMPVSTERLVLLYDSGTYEVGEKGARVTDATGVDVIMLNALQTINATQLLFDSKVIQPVDLIGALNVRNAVRTQLPPGHLPLRPTGDPLSFVRVIDHEPFSDWDRAMMPTRRC